MTDALSQGSPSRGHEGFEAPGAAPHLGASVAADVSTGSAALRIAIVGPTHPHKGGVAAHTTQTAHRLAALIPGAQLRLYPGAGHAYILEAEDRALAEVGHPERDVGGHSPAADLEVVREER